MKRGKKLLSLLLTLMLCLSLFPRAQAQESEGTIAPVESGAIAPVPVETQESGSDSYCGDDLTWSLDENGTLTISGTGDMWDWTMDESAWPSTPWQATVSRITRIRIEPGVTGIGNAAFYGCQNATDISIADTVKRIGSEAFSCCSGLLSLTIPEGVTSIGDSAFDYCYGLQSIWLPVSLSQVGSRLLVNCPSLTDISYGGTMAEWESLSVDYDRDTATVHCSDGDLYPTEPSYCGDDLTWSLDENGTLTISGTGDMWDWTMDESAWPSTPWQATVSRITRIRIEPGVTGIGNAAFYGCQNATDISIADTVKRIGSEAFSCCSGLLSLTIPEGVTSIGDSAFCNCFSLESVTIPASVTSIGEIAFAGCSSLMSIDVASDNAGYSSADGVLFNKDMSAILMYPGGKSGDYSIPESVTEIGEGAFARCGNLTNVAIPSGVNEIGDTAFYMCRSLTSVTIPSGVTSIGTATFVWCSSLRSITIPAAVNYIGNAAFDHCGLQEICFRGAAPVFASDESDGRQYQFGGVTATAYYPAGDPSWTESLRQDYCGSITWVAYEPGDMNDDAEVDSLDLMLLRKQLVDLPAEGAFNPAAADLNGDGMVDILDLVRLRKLLA